MSLRGRNDEAIAHYKVCDCHATLAMTIHTKKQIKTYSQTLKNGIAGFYGAKVIFKLLY
jgi:hypothetical protein